MSARKSEIEKTICFDRLDDFIDVKLMSKSTVSVCGIGGMAEGVIDLVRSGVAHFNLVDPDIYEPVNLATQGGEVSDLGKSKVEVIKRRIMAVNPDAKVTIVQKKYEDLSELENKRFWKADVALMMTDSFPAQAEGNKDSIKNNTPTIYAAAYMGMNAIELTWNAPDLTTHCHRCVTKSRYDAWDEGYEQPGSAGSYVFAGRQMNAMIGQLTLSMLHHYGSSSFPIAELIKSFGNKNFLLTKLFPDYGIQSGIFEPGSLPFTSKAYEPDTPKSFTCPDCAAVGVV